MYICIMFYHPVYYIKDGYNFFCILKKTVVLENFSPFFLGENALYREFHCEDFLVPGEFI